MKVRIFDVFVLMMIAALIYVQITEGRQNRSNHFFLKNVIGRRWLEHQADIATIDARLELIDPNGARPGCRGVCDCKESK